MDLDGNGLEELDRAACLALLADERVGRIGFTSRALPTVLPVNFICDGERILVRTGSGAKLTAALHDAIVAFEVDHFDEHLHVGWSVVVTGRARVVPIETLGVVPPWTRWAPLGDGHVISISVDLVTGRRLIPTLQD